jgi:hypothetical protein
MYFRFETQTFSKKSLTTNFFKKSLIKTPGGGVIKRKPFEKRFDRKPLATA